MQLNSFFKSISNNCKTKFANEKAIIIKLNLDNPPKTK